MLIKGKYLIVIKDEFCLNGEVVESQSELDLLESGAEIDDVIVSEFHGEFVLGVYSDFSKEKVLEKASIEEKVEIDMLKAYPLM